MLVLTLALVLAVILPQFQELFEQAHTQLPLATRIVMALGDFVERYGIVLAALICFAVIALLQVWRDPVRGLAIDRRLVSAKWTFGLVGKTQASRYLRTLATLARSGVPLPQAAGIAIGTLQNRALLSAGRTIHERLKQGEDLSALLEVEEVFPKVAVQLARVGEETGRLHELLNEAADTLDREVQTTLDRALSILIPAITIVMGAVVAALIASVLVGILSLNDLAF